MTHFYFNNKKTLQSGSFLFPGWECCLQYCLYIFCLYLISYHSTTNCQLLFLQFLYSSLPMLWLCHVVTAPAVDYQSVDSQRADQASSTNMRQYPNRWLLGSRLRKQATISDWARLSPWTILASDTIHCCASVCLLQLVFSVLQSKMEQIARSYYCLFNMWVWRGVSLEKKLCYVMLINLKL